MRRKLLRKGAALALLLTGASPTAALADMPDIGGMTAGAINAELDQDRAWTPKSDEPAVTVDIGETSKEAEGLRVKVKKFTFTGQDKISEDKLQAIVAEDLDKEMSFNDLQHAVQKVTLYLHKQGYMTAVAYLPTQEIIDGVVRIDILLGYYGDIWFENDSDLTTKRAEGLSHAARKGKIIRRQPMDRLLLIINDIPGVKAHAFLHPGKEPGTADTTFRLYRTERDGGLLHVDNYGSAYTGRWRIGGSYHINNVSHVGDQLQGSFIHSFTGGLRNFRLRYALPVGRDGVFAGIEYFRTDYTLGRQFGPLDAHGQSRGWRVFTRTPLKRTVNNNLFFHLQYAHTTYSDRYLKNTVDLDKHGDAVRFGLDGDYRDSRGASTYKLMHNIGKINLVSRDAYQPDIEGLYQKTTLDVYHIQKLSNRLMLHASLSAQYAWTNLDSSEKMYIGGYNAVRAYPQGEPGGDHGILSTVELRYQTGERHWQIAGFYDFGYARYSRRRHAGDNSRTLAGAGIGIIFTETGKTIARLDWAYPLTKRYSRSLGQTTNGLWWFQLVQRF